MNNILNQELQVARSSINELVKDLHDLTISIGHEALSKTVSDLRNRINEPFMFVIVGEVKAGKSSFINALLQTNEEVCKVAPQPMTDTIQQIVYGEKNETITLSPYLKKILLPVDILKEIAIVDTPGTNTIIEHHQEITESFIPASDLIVFVFEAKNPYRQSSWDFFKFLHTEWRRKIIFVLQQKDLVATDDLEVNLKGVKEHADKNGIQHPVVFAVSAKEEQEGKTNESGFSDIRKYINTHITGGKAPILKLINNLDTAQNINERIFEGVNTRKAQWEADQTFRQDITNHLNEQEEQSSKQVDILVENLLAAYDRITHKKEEELQQGLSFFPLLKRSFTAIFDKKNSAREWLNSLAANLETALNTGLKEKLDQGILHLADSIQNMAKIIDLKIKNSQTVLKNDHDIFSDIAERRSNVLRDLQETFKHFISQSDNFTGHGLFPDQAALSPNLATGSGIAIIGVILATVTNGMVFDITGGILTTIGLLFAGVSVGIRRRKITQGFHTEIAKGRLQLEEEINEKLKTYIQQIKEKIDGNFSRFDQMIVQEKIQIQNLESQQQSIENRIINLKSTLEK